MGFVSCFKEGRHLTRKFKSHQKQKQDPDLREVKYILFAVGLIMLLYVGTATIGQQAEPLRFLDGIIQYAEGAEFYINPDLHVFVSHDGTGTSCPQITGPASADNGIAPSGKDMYLHDSADAGGCHQAAYIWDEGSLIPRVYDQAIQEANRMYSYMEWGSTAWNSADTSGGGTGCAGLSIANAADPRINVTDTYNTIRNNLGGSIGGLVGSCDRDLVETSQNNFYRSTNMDEDYINRVNDTYYAIGGRLGFEGGSRDIADRSVDLLASQWALNFVFQIPADYTNNWWQMQEHPMFINEVGTPTGNQFSDNSPALIDSGFFGIDDTTFTMDTGLDEVERGQVAVFKQFNKANLVGGGGGNVTTMSLISNFTGFQNSTLNGQGIFFREDGLKLYAIVDEAGEDSVDEFTLSKAWDVSTMTYVQSFGINAENETPGGLHFKPDGKIMFIVGGGSEDEINSYTLSTAWDLSTASLQFEELITGDQVPRGIWIHPDGLRLWTAGAFSERIVEHEMTTAWDLSTLIPQKQLLSVITESLNPQTVEWSPDGFSFFILHGDAGVQADGIDRYDLTVAWDISTATFTEGFDLEAATGGSSFQGFHVKPGAKIMFTLDNTFEDIKTWSLTADGGYDITTASAFKTEDISAEGSQLLRLFISPDGTDLFTTERDGEDMNQYSLSTAWDISTSTFVTNQSASNEFNFINDLHFSPNGTKLIVLTDSSPELKQFDLSSAWDLSTISILQSSSTVTEDVATVGLWVRQDGLKMYVTGLVGDEVNEYDLTEAWNVSTKSFVQVLDLGASDEPQDVFFTPDGFTMLIISTNPSIDIQEWNLSTAWDISTAVHNSGNDFVTTEIPLGLFFKNDGSKMFLSATDDKIHSYQIGDGLPDFRIQGGIQSVTALGDTKIRIELRDHPIQAGQTQLFSDGDYRADGVTNSLDFDFHDGQDYFHKNQPIKYLGNGSLGVLDFEPTSLGAVEGFDFSLKPYWQSSTSDIVTLVISVQDNSTTGSLIANITSVEIENLINYNFDDINDLLFFEDDCSSGYANVDPIGNSGEGQIVNDENCGPSMSNGLLFVNNTATTGAIAGTLSTPAAVTGLTVGVITDDSLVLNWSHDSIDTTGFRIDRDDGSGLVEYISNTAVGGPNNEGGSIANRFIDINYNVTNYPSRANAFGLEENTQYSYRVCALNGNLVGTCSSTVAVTTPDSEPFWQLVEIDGGSGDGGILFSHDGGDGDWFRARSGLVETGEKDGWLIKAFNITELQLIEKNSRPMMYIDWDEQGVLRHTLYCNGEVNRFNTTIWGRNTDPLSRCVSGEEGFNSKGNQGTGITTEHKPELTGDTINLNTTYFPSGFVTVMIGVRDNTGAANSGFDIKNFTWINSTSWEFESGNGANFNWTARINRDNENANEYHYDDPGLSNCDGNGLEGEFIDHTFRCDLGTVKAVSSTHQILQQTEENFDWQYRESANSDNDVYSFGSISSNGSGLVIDNSFSQGKPNSPQATGKFFIWKLLPKSVLQQGNMTINMRAEGSGGALNIGFSVQNTTVTTLDDAVIDRWSAEQWSDNGFGSQGSGPTPNQWCKFGVGNGEDCVVAGVDIIGQLTARDGDQFAPFDPIRVSSDLSAFTNTTDTIRVIMGIVAGVGSEGTIMVENVTVGLVTYNFTNSNVKNELGENQFLRVAGVDPLDYQLYTGVLGEDTGLISPGSLIVEPPQPPTNLNATAVNPTVVLEWDAVVGADDYSVERSSGGWEIDTLSFSQGNGIIFGDGGMAAEGIFFRADGKRMYITDRDSPVPAILQFDVSTAWDTSTISFVDEFELNTAAGGFSISPSGQFFKTDGTKMYILSNDDDEVDEFDLSIAWNVSSATIVNQEDISAGGNIPRGMYIRDDGLKMYIADESGADSIEEWDFGVAWDTSTLTHLQSGSVNPLGVLTDLSFRNDGKKVHTITQNCFVAVDCLEEFNLSSAWDISTISFVQNTNATDPQDSVTEGLFTRADGLKLYTVGRGGPPDLNEYSLNATNFTTIAASVNLAEGDILSADYYDDFSTDQGWIFKNQTFLFLDTETETLNMTKLTGDPSVSNFGGVRTGGEGVASINIQDRLGADLGEQFSIRGKLVITDVDDTGGIFNTTEFGFFGHHSAHHSSSYFPLFTITGQNATDLPVNFCRSAGSDCFGLFMHSHFRDWQMFDSNQTHTIVPGSEQNLSTNAWVNPDEYFFELIVDRSAAAVASVPVGPNGPAAATFSVAVFLDDGFLMPHFCGLDAVQAGCFLPVDNPNNILTRQGWFSAAQLEDGFDSGLFDYLTLGDSSGALGNTGTHTYYTGTTHGLYMYWDEIGIWNNVNISKVTRYVDDTVDLGTSYAYRVSSIDTLTSPGFPATSIPSAIVSVFTNDIPAIVQNILTFFVTPNQIDIQWDDLPFNSGEGFISSGVNLTKYKLFRENVTAGTPFELLTELLATSPPPNFFNDTSVSFPDVFNYQTSGCNILGCGANSTFSAASVTDPPGAVLDTPVFNATAIDNTVSLDWNDVTFPINYTVLRGVSDLSLFSEDFTSYVSNATADLVWTHNDCEIQNVGGFCGVNATSDRIDFLAKGTADDGITYDLLTEEGFQVTDSNGNGKFTLIFSINITSFPSGTANFFVGIGNETGLELPSKDTDYLGIRFSETFGSNNPNYSVYMSDNQDRSINLLDAAINLSPTVSQRQTFFNMTFDSTTSTLVTNAYSDAARTINLGSVDRTNVQGSETYNNLRYLLVTPFGFSGADLIEYAIDDIELFVESVPSIIATGVLTSDYIDSTIALNTNYTYSAFGVNDNGNGATGSSNSVITNDVPSEPLNFISTMGLVSPFLETPILNWTTPADQGDGDPSTSVPILNYTVDRKQGIGAFSFLKTETNINQGGTTDDTAVVAANYTWHVQACNIIGCSPFSNTDTLIVTPTTVPQAVPSLIANTLSGTEIFLNWETPPFNVTNQPTEYRIQQRHVGFTGFVTILDTGNLDTEFTVDSLLSGNTYDYRVAGLSGAGQGGYSPIAQNTTFTVPTSPINLQADTLNKTAIFLDWEEPVVTNGGIIKYTVEIDDGGGFVTLTEVATTIETPDLIGLRWKVETNNISGATCGTSRNGPQSSGNPTMVVAPSNSALHCERQAVEFDISSIPDDAIITNVTIKYNNDGAGGDPRRNCDFRSLELQPSALTPGTPGATAMWDDVANGTDYIIGNTDCQTAALGYSQSIPAFIPDVQARLVDDWWGWGGKLSSEVRISSENYAALIRDYELVVEYINGTATVVTEYTVTGLTTKVEYDFRINATNIIGTGPYSNIATNTTFGVPDPPINLSGSTDGINEITVEWDQPLLNYGSEVTGYRIDQAQGIGGTWITAINDTGDNIEPLDETFGGLLPQTDYVFRFFAYNGFGISPASANLTQGTIIGPSEPENVFAVFNATKPYSVFISWETPLSDGGKAIAGYLVQRLDESSIFQLIANITNPNIKNFTDTSLLNLATHTYKVAAYSNPTGSFSPDQAVVTVVPANIINFTITDFEVQGDVLKQDYTFIVDDCFPTCTLTQADIERNGIVDSNIVLTEPVPLDSIISFTTWYILPDLIANSINTTAFVTNLGSSEDDEAGVTLATAEFLVPTSLFFNHTRINAFEDVDFTLIRHPVTWSATCEYQNGAGFGVDTSPFGDAGIQPPISLQNVGFFRDNLDVVPQLNTYVACFDPVDNQILSFTSFGFGNGSLALVSFTSQLGDFMGVPVPFIFIIFLAAIWTGRSASTGIIFLAVAIGAMGVLGYFPGLDGNPLLAGTFWSLIVLLTTLGVLVGKRFF